MPFKVRSLLELFRPLRALPTAPTHPVLNKPMNNVNHQISRPPLSEDAFLSRISPNQTPRLLNYKHVNELRKPTGCVYPVQNVVPYSAAAQPVPSQAPRAQFYSPASTITLEGTYAPAMGSGHTQAPPDPQYSHQTILNPQPEFHSSLLNMGSGHAQALQDSQHGYHNVVHPQPEFHSSLTTMGSSYTQPPPDPQYSHQTIIKPQPEFHSSLMSMGSGHAQTLQDSQHAYHNIVHPQLEFHSSVTTMGCSHIQSLQGPQYQSISNPSHDFHSSVKNAGSSHPQLSWGPHYTHQSIPNFQPDTYSAMANAGSVYGQILPDLQYTHQNAQNPQPDFNSSLANTGHANVTMQSHALLSSHYPYVPQEVGSSTYSSEWSGALQGVIPSGQQTGMGSEYYQSSMQTQGNTSTQENVVNHLHSTNSCS